MNKSLKQVDTYGLFLHDTVFVPAWKYVRTKFWRLELLAVFAVGAAVLTRLPYINLVFGTDIAVFCVLIAGIGLLQLKFTHVLSLIMALFTCAFVVTLFGNDALAERMGNFVYFLLWVAVILSIRSLRHGKQP